MPGKLVIAGFVILMGGGLIGCTLNPATGKQDFTPFMSPEAERQVGAREHPKILQEFGGAYEDPELARYINSIGQLLVQTSELPDLRFTFTILNSPIVNAFALPGGYIYVTRGLLALVDNEAELAAVLAHEIGHVTARHSAQRHTQATGAQIGLSILGALGLGGGVGSVLSQGTGLYLRAYSRDQERQADDLGIRYLVRAGFSPHAMATFLQKMAAYDRLERQLAGNSQRIPDFLSTHPQPEDRVARTTQTASTLSVRDPILGRNVYLSKIDGLLYGDKPEEGIIEGREFIHPVLGFAFTVPAGFHFVNSPQQVIASQSGGASILFDMVENPGYKDMPAYLTREWAPQTVLDRVEPIVIDGMKAATGGTILRREDGIWTVQLVAIAFDLGRIARFTFLEPPDQQGQWFEAFRRTTYSFRRLTASKTADIRPYRLAVVRVRPGDTVQSLAGAMAIQSHAPERFRVLNGLGQEDTLRPGEKVKVIIR